MQGLSGRRQNSRAGWPGCFLLLFAYVPARFIVRRGVTGRAQLHHQGNSFQFLLNHIQRTPCAFHSAGPVQSGFRR